MINPIGIKGSDEPIRPGGPEESSAAKKTAPVQAVQKVKEVEAEKGDKVEISALARDVQTIRANIGAKEADRVAHVEALRSKIAEGTYAVDTTSLAQKMFFNGPKGKE
jgi:flagellar biosynthesis anti-sigma factor FlgM